MKTKPFCQVHHMKTTLTNEYVKHTSTSQSLSVDDYGATDWQARCYTRWQYRFIVLQWGLAEKRVGWKKRQEDLCG